MKATALTIAGFDPTCGAGIVADVKTFSSFGCYGLSVVTAITVQNTLGVKSCEPLEARLVIEQLHALFDDVKIDAVKIGMLANAETALAVSEFLAEKRPPNIVLDTPFRSSSGHALLDSEGVKIVCEKLFPLAALIMPNLSEAAMLTGIEAANASEMELAAVKLHEMGARAVLVKGGHLAGEPIDIFYDGSQCRAFRAERAAHIDAHGTGCALSSAIAAMLARGFTLEESIDQAKRFITRAIENSLQLGRGANLLDL